jgi:predicted Zn-dependent protease
MLLRLMRTLFLAWLVWAGPLGLAVAAAPEPPKAEAAPVSPEEKAEDELGKAAAAELEKQAKVIKDSPDLPRLARIVGEIEPHTQRPKVKYEVKVLDLGAINAFSLPGGHLYVTRGTLAAVESEDELAAILAHEMAHTALGHAMKAVRREEKFTKRLGAVLVAAILAGGKTDAGAIAVMGSLIKEDALNHYGREAELEADRNGFLYLTKTHYNPVAMLTVVEGLARLEQQQPEVELGVFESHPAAQERVGQVLRLLSELAIPVNRREVIQGPRARAEAVEVAGKQIAQLLINDQVVFQPAVTREGLSPLERAKQMAEELNRLLLEDLQVHELEKEASGESARILARGKPIITIDGADAAFHQKTAAELADRALATLKAAFWQERVKRAY